MQKENKIRIRSGILINKCMYQYFLGYHKKILSMSGHAIVVGT